MMDSFSSYHRTSRKSQSLFYWIIYSYTNRQYALNIKGDRVSILILLDYLFLYALVTIDRLNKIYCLNPYFIGLSILIRSVEKALYLLLLQNFFQTLKSTFF